MFKQCLPLVLFFSGPLLAQDAPPMPANPPVQLTPSETLAPVQPPLAPLPIVLSEPPTHPAQQPKVVYSREFPRYAELKPAVAFWTRVFGEFSEYQSVVHSAEYPAKIIAILDFRDEAARLSAAELHNFRQKAERRAKKEAEDLLLSLHAKRAAPETLNAEERALYELFADVPGEQRFKPLFGSVRTQRGLHERTLKALEVSQEYLPEMERIFASYGLPKELTRLPLVESSFNIEAYSKVGAAGLWQFIPSSARIYMRLDEVVDDRRDPWTSTDAAARHLRDDYIELASWPLALTAYNHGRSGIARALQQTGGKTLVDLIERYEHRRFGFASRNFYAEFLAALDVEREWRRAQGVKPKANPGYDLVALQHYVPYDTLRQLSGLDEAAFRQLNPAYRAEVVDGKLYVPPGYSVRLPSGRGRVFETAYASLGESERFHTQRAYYRQHTVKKGERLARIARHYGVSVAAIAEANGFKPSKKLRSGQRLRIPPRGSEPAHAVSVSRKAKPASDAAYLIHKVRKGQTLSGIAKRYGVSVAALKRANDLIGGDIRIGMKLKVPGTS